MAPSNPNDHPYKKAGISVQQSILGENWQFKERDTALTLAEDFQALGPWYPAHVPGTVHQDLMAASLIPDPFVGLNDVAVQWVGERDWLYRCTFQVPETWFDLPNIDWCADGLDTIATIWLNGTHLASSENMFVPLRIPVRSGLRPGLNQLHIHFASAFQRGRELARQYGPRQVWNGDPSRVYVRKAQYHYGWDWGPCLLTAGIWQEMRLEGYATRISELACPSTLTPDRTQATVQVQAQVAGAMDMPDLQVHVQLAAPDGQPVAEATLPVVAGRATHTFAIEQPHLWWPLGYGEPARYTVTATLQTPTVTYHQQARRLGLRQVALEEPPVADEPGTALVFVVNGVPIFCGGANWIPADMFLPRVAAARYTALLQYAAAAHMVMLRVWGGGCYETDAFYDQCDELGILIWQDFMFACGLYPAHPTFVASVRQEAEAQVRRLRHHPSIVLWCGNNEDYQVAEASGVSRAALYGPEMDERFPARVIYEDLLPEVCRTLDPTRPYRPGSPFGGVPVNDLTQGDQHIWSVWHDPMAPYQNFPSYRGRFISEFGMASAPALSTIAEFVTPEERFPSSRTLEHHHHAIQGPRRLAVYLNDTLRVPADLSDYVYATQFVQAEALAVALSGWRRAWQGPGHYKTAGALIWQLEDCWPETSWAIIDAALRVKPAYYLVRRALAPVAVGTVRAPDGACDIWVSHTQPQPQEATLILDRWSLAGQHLGRKEHVVTLPANASRDLVTGLHWLTRDEVLGVALHINGQVVARTAVWPEPFKYVTMPDPQITLEYLHAEAISVQAKRPAKGVWLSGGDQVMFSDNMLDLLPGDPQVITVNGLAQGPINLRWLR